MIDRKAAAICNAIAIICWGIEELAIHISAKKYNADRKSILQQEK